MYCGGSDHKRSSWPCMFCTPQIINSVSSKNNFNVVRKQKIMAWEMDISAKNHETHYQTRLGTFERQTGQYLTSALKENRRGKKNQDICCCTVKSITKKSPLQMNTGEYECLQSGLFVILNLHRYDSVAICSIFACAPKV